MKYKRSVLILCCVLGILLFTSCSTPPPPQPEPPQPTTVPVVEEMTLEQARAIAEGSSCVAEGPLTGDAFYNANTGTWWLDLDIEKEGCNPACVVKVVDQSAEINWRCTGALPPKEDTVDEVVPLVPDPAAARDAALAFLRDSDVLNVPAPDADWEEADITAADLLGSTTYEYRYQDWVVVVEYPIVNPADTIYTVDINETATDLYWQGEVSASGEVIEVEMQTSADKVACWGGFIKSLPEGGQFDDYLSLGEEDGVGIEPADNTVAAQIQVVKDSTTFVHIWGTLHCPAIDYGGCYIEVTQLREDKPGPIPGSESISGWLGTIKGFADGAQHDDAFILAGDFPVVFGIESRDENLAVQLANLRDTGQLIKIWGEVSCGVPSPNGALITVNRIALQ
jgi:hypothetical protein